MLRETNIRIYSTQEGIEMDHTCVVISDNTLREILRNPHEFVSELRIVVCFGR